MQVLLNIFSFIKIVWMLNQYFVGGLLELFKLSEYLHVFGYLSQKFPEPFFLVAHIILEIILLNHFFQEI